MRHSGLGRSHDDPYQVLGVSTGASRQDIARAYRRAAHEVHPDTQPDDPRARARFQALTEAYGLLSDPGRRADYDRRHAPDRPDALARRTDPPFLIPPHGQQIWAGPVRVEPPAAQTRDHGERGSPPADVEDPPVILGRWLGLRRSRPW